MVKKRQADLDSSSLSVKPDKRLTSIRDMSKIKRKKNTAPRGFNQFVSEAKDLLFGNSVVGKFLRSKQNRGKAQDKPSVQEKTKAATEAAEQLPRLNRRQKAATAESTIDNPGLNLLPSAPGTSLSTSRDDRASSSLLSGIEKSNLAPRRRTRSSCSLEEISSVNSPSSRFTLSGKRKKSYSSPTSSGVQKDSAATNSKCSKPMTKKLKSHQSGSKSAQRSAASPRSSIQQTLKDLAHQTPARYDVTQADRPAVTAVHTDHFQKVWQIGDNSWVVAFSQRVEIRGFVKLVSLTPHAGALQVHGHILAYGEPTRICNPPGYHNGVIECYTQYQHDESDLPALQDMRRLTELDHLPNSTYKAIKSFWVDHPYCVLVHISEWCEPRLQPSIQQLPPTKVPAGYVKLSQDIHISDSELPARYSQTTLNAIDHLISQQISGSPLRVVVCGAKNLGKSTLIKYITNKLFQHSDRGVAHLECDPSQCEFSPPGCLTLHTITSPLLGPAWCNIPDEVDHLELYGAINADRDPNKYVECMRRLVKEHNGGESKHLPLLVNTMGWTQGLGLHFLSAIIAEVKPTHLLQLCVDGTSYHNFPEFSVFSLTSNDMFIPSDTMSKIHEDLNYELIPLTMPHCENLQYGSDVLRPILSRDLMTTSYMFKSARLSSRIVNDITPYRVSMSQVALSLGMESLPAHLWTEAINMQIMVLCTTSPSEVTSSDGDYKTVSDSAHLKVVGYGLIRAVDRPKKLLYITTPLAAEELANVNVLYKINGSITPEMWLFQQIGQVADESALPYLGMRRSGAGFISTATAKYKYRKGRN